MGKFSVLLLYAMLRGSSNKVFLCGLNDLEDTPDNIRETSGSEMPGCSLPYYVRFGRVCPLVRVSRGYRRSREKALILIY